MTDTLKMAREALEIGRACAAEVAQRLHTELAGYRQHKHDAADADVATIAAAIAAIDAQQAATVGAPSEFGHDIGANRFRVVKSAFWWHIRIGDGTANVGKFHSKLAAEDVALKMLTAFRDGAYMQHQRALAATPPAVQALPPFRVSELLIEAGYSGAAECAHFINGLRHAEAAHGIGAAAQMDAPPAVQAQSEPLTYSSTQATNCAGCGEHKHTPLRIDAMGGYICLTCIDKKLGTVLGEFGYPAPQQPLTDAEFGVAWRHHTGRIMGTDRALLLQAKAATESAHGIGAAAQGGE